MKNREAGGKMMGVRFTRVGFLGKLSEEIDLLRKKRKFRSYRKFSRKRSWQSQMKSLLKFSKGFSSR